MKKFYSIYLIAALMIIPCMKVEAVGNIITSEGSQNISINANIPSTFEVTIPDMIDITNREVKTFLISGTGNIASSQYLDIEVPQNVTMTSSDGKERIDLKLSIDKTQFSSTELAADGGVVANCSIDASNISSGVWTGEAEVVFKLKNNTP